MANISLQAAKSAKNDEFYTRYADIEHELMCYDSGLFNDMIVYCNCDNPEKSMFWKYFYENFVYLKLKKLVCSYYNIGGGVYGIKI